MNKTMEQLNERLERKHLERDLIRYHALLRTVLIEKGNRLARDHLSGRRHLSDGRRREEEYPHEEPHEEEPRPVHAAE